MKKLHDIKSIKDVQANSCEGQCWGWLFDILHPTSKLVSYYSENGLRQHVSYCHKTLKLCRLERLFL